MNLYDKFLEYLNQYNTHHFENFTNEKIAQDLFDMAYDVIELVTPSRKHIIRILRMSLSRELNLTEFEQNVIYEEIADEILGEI